MVLRSKRRDTATEEPGANPSGSSPLIGEGRVLGSYQTILALGRYISFPPGIAKEIGIEETIFLLAIAYSATPKDRWVCLSANELETLTCLTYKQQTRVRNHLSELGLLEEKTQRREHLMYYAVIEEKLEEVIETVKRKFAELTFGSNSTLPKGVSPSLPKVSSLLREEEVQEQKQEEATPSLMFPKPQKKQKTRTWPKKVFVREESPERKEFRDVPRQSAAERRREHNRKVFDEGEKLLVEHLRGHFERGSGKAV
jgi:hypothetical protein